MARYSAQYGARCAHGLMRGSLFNAIQGSNCTDFWLLLLFKKGLHVRILRLKGLFVGNNFGCCGFKRAAPGS
jgi:hypothetical protein